MNARRSIVFSVFAGLLLPGAAAWAQSLSDLRATIDDTATTDQAIADPNLAVTEEAPPRRRTVAADLYAPQGIGTGGLRLYPTLGIGTFATSNVQGSATDAESDVGLGLAPAVRIESDWVRHQWTAGASGDLTFHAEHNDLDSRGLNLFQRLRIDVRRGTTGSFETSYIQDQSGIENNDVPQSAVGLRTEHTATASAALSHDLGGYEARVRAGAIWRMFDDVKLQGGGSEDNGDRNYVEPVVSLRATFTDPPVIKPYVEAAYTPRIHERRIDRNGLRRDSDGYTFSAGVTLDAGPIWSGDMAVSYLRRDYEDGALDSNSAIGLNGNLTWSPTDITRIVLSLGTSLSETASATSSGGRDWTIGIDASHALRDNVDLLAGLGAEIETESGDTDVTYDANLGIAWQINPSLSWTAAYDFTWLNAATANRDYTIHRISTGITLSR